METARKRWRDGPMYAGMRESRSQEIGVEIMRKRQ